MIESVLILTASILIWGGLHSFLASAYCKGLVHKKLGKNADRWYRLIYNILAFITLVPILLLLAVLPDQVVYAVPQPWRWVMRGGQLLAMIGFLIAFWETNPLDFLGLEQLRRGQKSAPDSLRITGMYCRIRHPLYTFGILFIWMTPTMTVNGLVIFFFTTLYLYIGSIHEEARLVAEFGQAYQDYQQRVPRLIPRPGRCYQETTLS